MYRFTEFRNASQLLGERSGLPDGHEETSAGVPTFRSFDFAGRLLSAVCVRRWEGKVEREREEEGG